MRFVLTSSIDSKLPSSKGVRRREGMRRIESASALGCKARQFVLLGLMCGLLAACGDRAVGLYSGLSEAEANRLVAYLDTQGIRSKKLTERDGTSVTVSASQLAVASRLATQAGLPRSAYKGFGAVFPKDGLISSPLEERARMTYAVSQELEAMLVEMDGVLGARVNVVIPERRNGRNTDLPAAAVLIRYASGMETDLLEMKVRRLVASSVPGLVEGDDRQISVSFIPVGGPPRASSFAATATPVVAESSSVSSGVSSVQAAATPTPSASSVLPTRRNVVTAAALPSAITPAPDSVQQTANAAEASHMLTWLSVGLGVVCALAAIGWALRGQLSAMFRARRPVAPAA